MDEEQQNNKKNMSIETESVGIGKSQSGENERSIDRNKSKVEFGNEMQETFQLGSGADLGAGQKSGGSQERNNIV